MDGKNWKFYLGLACFGSAWILPFGALLVPYLGLPSATAAVVSGTLLLGVPEVLILASVALLGKETFQYLKDKALGVLKLPQGWSKASKGRYHLALFVMVATTLIQWLGIYHSPILSSDPERLVHVRITLDILFLISVVMAGSQFWEKFRRLFVYETEE